MAATILVIDILDQHVWPGKRIKGRTARARTLGREHSSF